MSKREEMLAELASGEFKDPTQEENDAAHAADIEAHGDEEAPTVLLDEEIEASKGSQVLEYVDEEAEEAPEGEAEEVAEEAGEEVAEEGGEPEELTLDEYRRQAAARAQEIHRIREINRNLRAEQEATRGMVEEVRGQLAEMQKPQVDPAIANDPAIKYLNQRFEDLESRLPSGEQQQQALGQTLRQTAARVNQYGYSSAQRYKEHTPDWDDAYQHARAIEAKRQGIADNDPMREDKLNLMEQSLVYQWMNDGMDPAHEIYEYARANGYKSNGAAPQRQEAAPPAKVRRLKHGIENNSAAEIAPSAGARRSGGTITRDAFFRDYDQGQRMHIFQQHPDAFEELAVNGEIPVRYLP